MQFVCNFSASAECGHCSYVIYFTYCLNDDKNLFVKYTVTLFIQTR